MERQLARSRGGRKPPRTGRTAADRSRDRPEVDVWMASELVPTGISCRDLLTGIIIPVGESL